MTTGDQIVRMLRELKATLESEFKANYMQPTPALYAEAFHAMRRLEAQEGGEMRELATRAVREVCQANIMRQGRRASA